MNTCQTSVKDRYIIVALLTPTPWVLPDNTRSPQGSHRADKGVQANLTNTDLPKMYIRSTAETIMHPIGQNILLIYPRFGIVFFHWLSLQ